MKRLRFCMVLGISAALFGCAGSAAPNTDMGKQASEAAQASAEYRRVAQTVLGEDAELLAFGDLASNGREQIVAVNRIPAAHAEAKSRSVDITRGTILEKDPNGWNEVLRCDEYLKNPKGYLGSAPFRPTSGWQLRMITLSGAAREFDFTPVASFDGMPPSTIAVRWNPRAGRYQAMDRKPGRFLAEVPLIGIPTSVLR